MKLDFFKYHGTGNDFILIDNRDGRIHIKNSDIAALCHRRFGIGADGLIILNTASGYDFGMKYYNSDGEESSMCGNGGRCIIAFADFLSLSSNDIRFLGPDGEHTGTVILKNGDLYQVKLSMSEVKEFRQMNGDFILNTGSPHLVRFVTDVKNVDVIKEGRILRHLDTFRPGGINVNFVEDRGGEIFVRTYERGVEDETLSCGTGVTASALAYAATKNIKAGTIHINTPGGALSLHFNRKDTGFADIFLEGPAVKVFHGSINL